MIKYDICKKDDYYVLYEIISGERKAIASHKDPEIIEKRKSALEEQQRILG